MKNRTSKKRCPKCSFRRRGSKHEEGAHHKGTVADYRKRQA